MTCKSEGKMKIAQHKTNGLRLEFGNGMIVSTIWGRGSYSDNHDFYPRGGIDRIVKAFTTPLESSNVEVMIWYEREHSLRYTPNRKAAESYIKRLHKEFDGDGSVIGYIPVDEWARLVARLSKWRPQ